MTDHKPGCPAEGGYGQRKEACICGASDTPRTDAEDVSFDTEVWTATGTVKVVKASFARQLERELAECKAALQSATLFVNGWKEQAEKAEAENAKLREALEHALACWPQQEILEALEPADTGYSRLAPLENTPRTKEVRKWRAVLRSAIDAARKP